MTRTTAMLATALTLAAAAPAAAAASGPLTIGFQAATTSRDQHAARTAGTFAMTGALGDAGTMSTAYHFAGTRIDATATLIGAREILTIGMRGTLGGIVDDRQHAAGRWDVCGGTGRYRRLAGHGPWQAVVDVGAASAGMLPPTVSGALIGRVSRRSTRMRTGSPSRSDARC